LDIRERIQSAVNVRPGEGRTAALMLAHSFFMGLSTVFFETAASALFLARFGPGVLPFVYITAALLNTATGAVYTAVQARVAFRALMSGTLLFLLATTVALRAGLALSSAAWLLFALLVWYRAISALTDLEYWAVAGHLYDVRQAKRLFGFIGTGEVVARIIGSFAVPLLVHLMGVANLLELSAAAMAACLVLVGLVLRTPVGAEGGAAAAKSAVKAPRPAGGLAESLALFRDRYLLLIFALSFFGVLAKYFVDFAFLAEMRARYGDVKGLASFFAIFSGVSQTLSLLTRLFVSGRLLDRYGIRLGLLVLPAMQVVCTLLLVGAGFVPGAEIAVFWLVIANQGVYKTLKHPIDNPSFKVLYQPLKKERRLSAQIAVETLVTPITIGIAGGVMLLFTKVLPYDPVKFALAMLGDFGAWLVVAVAAGGAYAGALKEALKKRLDDEQAFELLSDETSLSLLRARLRSERADEVLPALELLDKAGERGQRGLDGVVLELMRHPALEVRRAALAYVGHHRPAGAARAVAERLRHEPTSALRASALRSLCLLEGSANGALASYLDDPQDELRRAAAIGLLTSGAPAAEARVTAAAVSPVAVERTWAAQVLGEAGRPALHPLLSPLLEDADAGVRRAALVAASRVRASELWPVVALSLAERSFAGAAAAALGNGGPTAVAALDDPFWRSRSTHARVHIVRVWGRIGGPEAVRRLEEHLRFPDARVRYEVMRALRACGYQANGAAAARIEECLSLEAEDAAWKLAVHRDLGTAAELAHVRAALEREVDGARHLLLLLLSFVLDASAIRRAADGLRHESRDRRAYAIEMLDVTLSAEWRTRLMPMFEELSLEQRLARLLAIFPQETHTVGDRLKELLRQPPGRLASWTLASVLHATVGLHVDGAADALPGALAENTMLHEAALWARASARRGSAGQSRGRSVMLTIEKVILLKGVHMFMEASDEIVADVASIVEEVEVPRGAVVIEKGDPGDSMYVIVEGKVRVYDGERTIVELGPRDIFGELALLDPEPRFASVAAEIDTRLLRLDREAFLELMEGNIEIVRGVLHVLCERLRSTMMDRVPYHDRPASPTGSS
jgi:AAA family ATP:ADP antiporter